MKKDENIIYFVCTHTLTSGPDEVMPIEKMITFYLLKRKVAVSGCGV